MASCTPHLVTHPSRLDRWRTDQWSLFSLLSFSLSFSPRAVRRLADSLAPRNASLVAGSFARPPSPSAPFPVSPLPCLRSDTVWLVLWLVTVLRPCQIFVLRESAGLALFRSLTVPLLGSVPSRCRCFTLLALFAWFLWLLVVSCGTGLASTSIDNLWPPFHFRWLSGNSTLFTTTYAQSHFSPSSTGWAHLSQIVNYSLFLKNLQHLPTYGTNIAFPFGRLTCVLSASPTSPWSNRPRNRLHLPAPALSGRLLRGWCFLRFLVCVCCFQGNRFPLNLRLT